jgi:hypothetical protein
MNSTNQKYDENFAFIGAVTRKIKDCVARQEIYKCFCYGYLRGDITCDKLKVIQAWSEEVGNIDVLLEIPEVKSYVHSYIEILKSILAKEVNKVEMYVYHFPQYALEKIILGTYGITVESKTKSEEVEEEIVSMQKHTIINSEQDLPY